jgi:DNA-binding Xre family transcriptional regulator
MKVSYNKLFKLLIDKQMKKGELCRKAGISTTALEKLAKGKNVTVDTLVRVCAALDCTFDDISELLPEDKENTGADGGAN